MKKRNTIIRIAMLAIVISVVSFSLASSTFAKYTETVSGADTAKVAKFAYTATGGSTALSTDLIPVTIDLFETDDDGVRDLSGDQKLIAPGTSGTFAIVVDNESDVLVKAEFTLALANTGNIPVVFNYESLDYPATTEGIGDLVAALNDDFDSLAIDEETGDSVSASITWTWAFDGVSDSADTTLGLAGTAVLGLTIAATITQLNG